MGSQLPRRHVVVIGGGISGLSTAYALAQARQDGEPIDELLIEASDRLGGVIRTERVEEFLIEGGPDSFLGEKPDAAALCRELGLGESLLGSNDMGRRTYILHRGQLVPIPIGFRLFVPASLWAMATTPLLSLRSKIVIAAEWFSTPAAAAQGGDESIADFVRRHFGDEMLENIADPLLSGVFGGDSANLSVGSVLSRLKEMEKKSGSLIRAFRQLRKDRSRQVIPKGNGRNSLFMTVEGGLGELVRQLTNRLERDRILLQQRVVNVDQIPLVSGEEGAPPSPQFEIRCESREGNQIREVRYKAHAVVLALPAYAAGRILARLDPALSTSLGSIPYASAMTVTMAYDSDKLRSLPAGFGFLVPRKEKRRLLACTFVHGKFPHRAPAGRALIRCFLGGTRDPDVLSLSDDEIMALVRAEMENILHFDAQPLFHRIYRWPNSMPQYVVGHADRIGGILSKVREHAGLYLAGNAYSGVGIPDCIRGGRAAAQSALEFLTSQS